MSPIDTLKDSINVTYSMKDYSSTLVCGDCVIVVEKCEAGFNLHYTSVETKQIISSIVVKNDCIYNDGDKIYVIVGRMVVSIFKDLFDVLAFLPVDYYSNFKIKYSDSTMLLISCNDRSGEECILRVGIKDNECKKVVYTVHTDDIDFSIRHDSVRVFVHRNIPFMLYRHRNEVIISSFSGTIVVKSEIICTVDNVEYYYTDSYINNKHSSLIFKTEGKVTVVDTKQFLDGVIDGKTNTIYTPSNIKRKVITVPDFKPNDRIEVPYYNENMLVVQISEERSEVVMHYTVM